MINLKSRPTSQFCMETVAVNYLQNQNLCTRHVRPNLDFVIQKFWTRKRAEKESEENIWGRKYLVRRGDEELRGKKREMFE